MCELNVLYCCCVGVFIDGRRKVDIVVHICSHIIFYRQESTTIDIIMYFFCDMEVRNIVLSHVYNILSYL